MSDLESNRSAVARRICSGVAALLVVWSSMAGCAPAEVTSEGARSAEISFEAGDRIELTPGTVRERDARAPLIWASVPTPRITVESGRRAPPTRSFRISNIDAATDLEIREATYLSGEDREGCSGAPSGSVDCSNADDPLCRALSFSHEFGSPAQAILRVDLPACARIGAGLELTIDRSKPVRIATIGSKVPADQLDDIVEAAARQARIVVLTGDHASDSNKSALRDLAGRLKAGTVPIVFTPGEVERINGATSAFRNRFGPSRLSFELGAIQFLGFDSSRQTLGRNGVERLRSRLRDLERTNPIVAFTHTPPIDPKELRGTGFRSEVEAARTLSTLSSHRTDLLVAGHLPEPHTKSYANVTLAVPPGGAGGGYAIVELTPRTAGADAKLAVEIETSRP